MRRTGARRSLAVIAPFLLIRVDTAPSEPALPSLADPRPPRPDRASRRAHVQRSAPRHLPPESCAAQHSPLQAAKRHSTQGTGGQRRAQQTPSTEAPLRSCRRPLLGEFPVDFRPSFQWVVTTRTPTSLLCKLTRRTAPELVGRSVRLRRYRAENFVGLTDTEKREIKIKSAALASDSRLAGYYIQPTHLRDVCSGLTLRVS